MSISIIFSINLCACINVSHSQSQSQSVSRVFFSSHNHSLITLFSACWVFSCFHKYQTDMGYRIFMFNVRTWSFMCAYKHWGSAHQQRVSTTFLTFAPDVVRTSSHWILSQGQTLTSQSEYVCVCLFIQCKHLVLWTSAHLKRVKPRNQVISHYDFEKANIVSNRWSHVVLYALDLEP